MSKNDKSEFLMKGSISESGQRSFSFSIKMTHPTVPLSHCYLFPLLAGLGLVSAQVLMIGLC